MKKFIAKLFIFLGLLVLVLASNILFSFFVIKNQHTQSYEAALYDKLDRLESIDEPKIVLVGNSSVSFGFCSPMLEEAFQMPVVNLGLQVGLGNAFHEEMAKTAVNEGDIIIICHTTYDNDSAIGKRLWETCEWNASAWELAKNEDAFSVITAMPSYILSNFELWLTRSGNKSTGTCYSRDAFNEYGDIVFRPETHSVNFQSERISVPVIHDACIERINELNDYVTERKATLLVAAYPIADGENTDDRSEFIRFQEELAEKLDCAVISDYTDYFYPYEYFYNAQVHLTEEGAKVRTQQLIDDLTRYLSSDHEIIN